MGYTQSLRPEQMGLGLQMDMAVTAFLEPGPVIDFLTRAAGLRSPRGFARASREQVRKADKAISGIKVRHPCCLQSQGLPEASPEHEGRHQGISRALSDMP